MKELDLERKLIQRFACPVCQDKLDYRMAEGQVFCQNCYKNYPCEGGIWRMLTELETVRYAPFKGSYRVLRQGDGWERSEPEYYLNLPYVNSNDPQAPIWRIRRRSFNRLQHLTGPGMGRWALELGAGNGWLARHLAKGGFYTVAMDLNATGPDSLEGAQIYLQEENIWFGRVQASMENLPFREEAFAICVVSGALHYANLETTLRAIWKVLEPNGQFIITDSPVYTQAVAGKTMVYEQQIRLKAAFGLEPYWPGGEGFLLEATLLDEMRQVGFEVEIFSIERHLGRLKHWLARSLKPGKREEARFPVIMGRKLTR